MSNYIMPLIVLFVIIYGILKKIPIYDIFIEGAKESFDLVFKLFPCLLAMILSINIFLKSNIIELFQFISFIPNQILPMIIMRPISGTSSLAILTNIYEQFGPDSTLGILASYIQGTTDTTFYIITLYFGSIGIKKIKYALWVGLLADLISISISLIALNFINI